MSNQEVVVQFLLFAVFLHFQATVWFENEMKLRRQVINV